MMSGSGVFDANSTPAVSSGGQVKSIALWDGRHVYGVVFPVFSAGFIGRRAASVRL